MVFCDFHTLTATGHRQSPLNCSLPAFPPRRQGNVMHQKGSENSQRSAAPDRRWQGHRRRLPDIRL